MAPNPARAHAPSQAVTDAVHQAKLALRKAGVGAAPRVRSSRGSSHRPNTLGQAVATAAGASSKHPAAKPLVKEGGGGPPAGSDGDSDYGDEAEEDEEEEDENGLEYETEEDGESEVDEEEEEEEVPVVKQVVETEVDSSVTQAEMR